MTPPAAALREEAPSFDAVPAPIAEALAQRGFAALTKVQEAVLAPGARGRDLQVSSQTGSGKTVALGLVLAPGLVEASAVPRRGPLALVVAPTRELAVQVSSELEWLYAGIPSATVASVTGGRSVVHERRALEKRPAVVAGTPGRLLDHIRRGALDPGQVAEVVLDEADRMLDMGFREELEGILDSLPEGRRTHLVSATFPAAIRGLAARYQKDPLSVEGTRLGVANEDIEHVVHLVRPSDRYAAIVNVLLMAAGERALVFVSTRAEASELAERLAADGFPAAPISGELEQNQRTRTLDAFRNGATTVLVATDVAARGLDIPEVALVLHTDAPFDAESYTHRAGRTGRAGRKGRSVLLATPMRRRKVDFLLSRARVAFEWREVPSAESVEKALAKRERRRVREALAEAAAPSRADRRFAASLLEGADAEEVVARLVLLGRDPRLGTPRQVEALAPDAPSRERAPRGDYARGPRAPWGQADGPSRPRAPRFAPEDGPGARGPRRGERHDDQGQEPREARGAARPQAFRDDRSRERDAWREPEGSEPPRRRTVAERFEINWGERGGATPQRVLAVLCRRGQVSSRAIGAIEIQERSTVFEVAREVAGDFERSAAEPDERDPRLFIRRMRAWGARQRH